jgi:hypothetical protein
MNHNVPLRVFIGFAREKQFFGNPEVRGIGKLLRNFKETG